MNAAPLPLYAQLKSAIVADIRSGKLQPGGRIPSQRDLGVQHGISHMTVRRALNELLSDGVIVAIPGKGIYVASDDKEQAETAPFVSFTEDMAQRGLHASNRVIDQGVISANTALANLLQVEIGAAVVYLQRLRLADGEPIAVQTAYLPYPRFPDLLTYDFGQHSLYAILRGRYGVALGSSRSAVEAALADAREAEWLGLTLPAALLVTEQITEDAAGLPFEYVRSQYRADRYKMRLGTHKGTR